MIDSPLAASKSPFLRHGAEQPVAWQAWGKEAFERARAEDRPILLRDVAEVLWGPALSRGTGAFAASAFFARECHERYAALGATPVTSATPEEFATFIRNEFAKWAKVIKTANIKL